MQYKFNLWKNHWSYTYMYNINVCFFGTLFCQKFCWTTIYFFKKKLFLPFFLLKKQMLASSKARIGPGSGHTFPSPFFIWAFLARSVVAPNVSGRPFWQLYCHQLTCWFCWSARIFVCFSNFFLNGEKVYINNKGNSTRGT
jgi:hypothetical protein